MLLAAKLLKVRDERRARAGAEEVSCRVIQRVGRGMLGRKKVQERIKYWQVRRALLFLSLSLPLISSGVELFDPLLAQCCPLT